MGSSIIQFIILQLAAEMFSLEDVQYLQKINRDLRAQNIKKTMAYIKLEEEYHLIKGMVQKLLNKY